MCIAFFVSSVIVTVIVIVATSTFNDSTYKHIILWVGLYYILSHERTYCKPTPLFCADVRVLAHELTIRTLRYLRHLSLSTSYIQVTQHPRGQHAL